MKHCHVDFLVAALACLTQVTACEDVTPSALPATPSDQAHLPAAQASGTVPAPEVSVPAGFHAAAFALELKAPSEDVAVHYTLDGSTPTAASPIYRGPIAIGPQDTTSFELAGIRTSDSASWRAPTHVSRGVVVKAVAIRPGGSSSAVVTHTYFVDPSGDKRYSLPVVSLSTEKGNFFDVVRGIYVPGTAVERQPRNYHKSGAEWERPVHIEYFVPGTGRVLSQDGGIRLHGNSSRNLPQKALRLYARAEYGEKWFTHPLFDAEPHGRFKRLLLRVSGNDWTKTLFRDALMQSLVSHLPIETQSYQPVVVFINAEYWGIHNLREHYDEHHLAELYGLESERIDLLTRENQVEQGSRAHFDAVVAFVGARPTMTDADVDHLNTLIDVDSFLQYMIAEIYFNNTDWPGNNTDLWRYQADAFDPKAPAGHDGRWRWLVHDTDFGFGYAQGANPPSAFDLLEVVMLRSKSKTAAILRALLSNASFRARFISDFTNHLNITFHPTRVLAMIDAFAGRLSPEFDEHIARWGTPASREQWVANVAVMRSFAQTRPTYVRLHLRSQFSLGSLYLLTVSGAPADAGIIRVGSLAIHPTTPGIAEGASAWTGSYFRRIPLTLIAEPRAGYVFVRWSDGNAQAQRTIAPSDDVTLTAEFALDPASADDLTPTAP